jgi:hypothetical protein
MGGEYRCEYRDAYWDAYDAAFRESMPEGSTAAIKRLKDQPGSGIKFNLALYAFKHHAGAVANAD